MDKWSMDEEERMTGPAFCLFWVLAIIGTWIIAGAVMGVIWLVVRWML